MPTVEEGMIRANPARFYGLIFLAAAAVVAVALWHFASLDPLPAWLIAITAATLAAYGYDKAIAGSGRTRVPERVLLGLAAVGGTFGAVVGMWLFRHKTRKGLFRLWLTLIAFAQLVMISVYYSGLWPQIKEWLARVFGE